MKKIDFACIIDDDPIFIFGAKRIIQLANFFNGFMVFHNGKEALESLKPLTMANENVPEVILLDLNMFTTKTVTCQAYIRTVIFYTSHKIRNFAI